jgi:hypothetical protein
MSKLDISVFIITDWKVSFINVARIRIGMEEEVERRVEYFHMLLGFAAGIVSGRFGTSGGLIGLAIGYSGFFLAKAIFRLSRDEFPLNTWVSKGAMPFLMFWLPSWIFVFNL